MKFIKKHWGFWLTVLISLFAILPFLSQGFFPIHDDTQVARTYEMWKALSDGMFPVRWVPDLGYGFGYPIFNFYAPLSYYAGALFIFIGFDALIATKLIMALGVVLSGIFMYLLAREFWGEIGGVISGLFYVFAPYHAVEIFVRGDVAEFWGYAFIPLMFLGLHKVFLYSNLSGLEIVEKSKLELKTKNGIWGWILVAGVSYAGIILSHNLTAMMVTPFLIIILLFYCFIGIYQTKKLFAIYYLLFAILLGLSLSAFYWLPALLEMQFTNVGSQIGGGADFHEHFVCIYQLWDSPWGFGGSAPGCVDGVSFKIGKVDLFLSFLAIVGVLWFRKKYSPKQKFVVYFSTIGLLVSFLFMINISKFIWESVPFMDYFQYPWRFLILASFFTSLISGAILINLKSKSGVPLGILIIVILLISNIKLFEPQTIISTDASYYTSKEALLWRTSRISDEFMPKGFNKPLHKEDVMYEKIVITAGNGKVIDLVEKTQKITFGVDALTDVNVLLRLAPFPAWNTTINNGGVKTWDKNNGIEFSLPHGKHIVEAQYLGTMIEEFGNLISLVGVSFLIVGIINLRQRENI